MSFKRVQRLLVLAVLAGSVATAAGAMASVTVTVTPGGAWTGSSGSGQIVFNTARRTVSCTSFSTTDTWISATGLSFPVLISTNMQLFCAGARGPGGVSAGVSCPGATMRVSATGAPGATAPLSLSNIACTISLTGCSVRLAGAVPATFDNTTAQLSVDLTGQALAATGSSCATLPNDANVTITGPGGAALVFATGPPMTIF